MSLLVKTSIGENPIIFEQSSIDSNRNYVNSSDSQNQTRGFQIILFRKKVQNVPYQFFFIVDENSIHEDDEIRENILSSIVQSDLIDNCSIDIDSMITQTDLTIPPRDQTHNHIILEDQSIHSDLSMNFYCCEKLHKLFQMYKENLNIPLSRE